MDTAEYLKLINAVERYHIEQMRLVADFLAEAGYVKIKPVQAMIMWRFDRSSVPVNDIEVSFYSGTNVSYNLSVLVKTGLLTKRGALYDRRVILYDPTWKGESFRLEIDEHFKRAKSDQDSLILAARAYLERLLPAGIGRTS